MRVTDKSYLNMYMQQIGNTIHSLIETFNFSEENKTFDYLTKSSAVYSSNIEGNTIDLNSFMNYELTKKNFKPTKEVEEIESLIEAYKYAQDNVLNESGLLKCHKILSTTLLIESKRGLYREEPVGVFGKTGLIYLAVEPEYVKKEMKLFFDDVSLLLKSELSKEEVFYHASLIHLRFVHIHPFMDGNGRAARLLEKWFISQKLGHVFWEIPLEEFYKDNQKKYYTSIDLGVNYYEIDYSRCIDFLLLSPKCLKLE